jgi:hypothetical protein
VLPATHSFAHTLAKRLVDPDSRVADFAKLFFTEYDGKNDLNM